MNNGTQPPQWRSWRGFWLTSIGGGLWLWFAAVAHGGKAGFDAFFFFFLAIPIACVISAVVTVVVVWPLCVALWHQKWGNFVSVAAVGSLIGLIFAALIYTNVETVLGKLRASWWSSLWVGGMTLLFWALASPRSRQSDRSEDGET